MNQPYTGLESTKPTSIWCCTPGDIIVLSITLLIIILLAIAGIAIGVASATIGSKCSNLPLPNGDITSYVFNVTGYSLIAITGDVPTTFVINSDPYAAVVIVNVTRQSLQANTYKDVVTTLTVGNNTQAIISTSTPTTDFTDCVYIVRTIVLPQNMQSIALEMNIWKSDITFTNSDTYYQLSNLTIYGGANNINLNTINAQAIILSATTGTVNIYNTTSFFALVGISLEGTLNIANSTTLVGQYTTRDGSININNLVNSYSPNPFFTIPGNITTNSRGGQQNLNRIKGSNVMNFECSYCLIYLNENAGDFEGTYLAQSRHNQQVTVQGTGVSPSGSGYGTISGTVGTNGKGTLILQTDWSIYVQVR